MLAALWQIPQGDVVLLYGCCHNPTGIDPTPEQWAQIGDTLAERSLLPLVDLAYQGSEVQEMRDRINQTRSLFADCPAAKGVQHDFAFVKRQRGMFTMTGLTPEQVEQLRIKHSIYMVRSGRINVAGMTESRLWLEPESGDNLPGSG